MTDGTIATDVPNIPEMDIDGAALKLLDQWGMNGDGSKKKTPAAPPKEEPKDEPREEAPEDDDGEEAPETDAEEDAEETDEEAPETTLADDDHEVVVKVGDKETKVKVGDLKRLYGQESSLTQKSQEVARQRQVAEETAQRHLTALNAMAERAKDAYKPFANIDWRSAQSQLTPEEFQALSAQERLVKANMEYYEKDLNETLEKVKTQAAQAHREQAAVCVQTLKDPTSPFHVADWSDKLYSDMMTHYIKQGIPQERVTRIVDPDAIKIMHKAYLYDLSQKEQKAAVKKLTEAPKNVAGKPGNNAKTGTPQDSKERSALNKLKRTGSLEDAAAALEARWRK